MNLILFTKRNGKPASVELGRGRPMAVVAGIGALTGALLFAAGAGWAHWRAAQDAETAILAWQQDLAEQQAQIDEARRAAEDSMVALAMRLGQAQAHVLRLDALGQRLTRMADLDEGEFDFAHAPALGGPELRLQDEQIGLPDFVAQLETLAAQLERREGQLAVLENLMLNRNLQREVLPAGRPALGGWLSSRFGYRTDPFTGKRAFHGGVDIAGRRGTPIVATASGVVTYSGRRYGYGKLVEINHGNGFSTRYAHNHENLVEVGDTVRKGDHIALMGATGRATAPHVHFEVLENGRVVNPTRYLRAAE